MSDAALAEENPVVENAPPPPSGDDPPAVTPKGDDPPAKSAAPPKEPTKEKAPTEAPSYWPKDWREKAAEHYSAGDKDAYAKELKRLERITDPAGMYGMYREMESRFSEGGLTKIPGEDATDEEKSAFWRQLGAPESADDYVKNLKLQGDAVLGDLDKPIAETFAQALHSVGAPQQVYDAALNWYYQLQEQQMNELDEKDDKDYEDNRKQLRSEFGGSLDRYINTLGALFADAPGGADPDNPRGVMARLFGGRTSDGRIIGNDPDVVRFLVGLNRNMNPNATEVDPSDASSGVSIDNRIKEIKTMMRENRSAYNKDYEVQAEYQRLLERREMLQSRKRA